jgi:hypothetical protein
MLWPLTFGSGKFGTPWEHMHLAKSSAPAFLLVAVAPRLLLVGAEEPQAPIATAQLTAAAAIGRLRRWLLASVLLLALRNGGGFSLRLAERAPVARPRGLYDGLFNTAVTPLYRR